MNWGEPAAPYLARGQVELHEGVGPEHEGVQGLAPLKVQ